METAPYPTSSLTLNRFLLIRVWHWCRILFSYCKETYLRLLSPVWYVTMLTVHHPCFMGPVARVGMVAPVIAVTY